MAEADYWVYWYKAPSGSYFTVLADHQSVLGGGDPTLDAALDDVRRDFRRKARSLPLDRPRLDLAQARAAIEAGKREIDEILGDPGYMRRSVVDDGYLLVNLRDGA